MSDYRITLKPVYSQTVPTPEELKLPEGWLLSWHQLETWRALQDPNIDVVFNTAMTGDGKSLAAFLSAMTGKTYTLAMYPTNELARDQEKQVQGYKLQFQPKYEPQIQRLNAGLLEEYIVTYKLPSKLEALSDVSSQSEILLTNPDIFHYINNFYYLRGKIDNPDRLFRRIHEKYKLFVYDEFHIFSSPQVTSVINSLLLVRHTATHQRKFLFLSATPNPLLINCLDKARLKYRCINPIEQGKYCFSLDSAQNNWRQISQPINLNFPKNLEPNLRSGYTWLAENADQVVLKFFQDYPNSKGAIILNSIAAVKKLLPKFKALLEPRWQVRENTGLTSESEKSCLADLLLGTSTIDVGVDFAINFLIFEATDAGNFIQRLGRLGRHKGFDIYQAYALIPNFLVSGLFEDRSHLLQDGEIYDRITFNEVIRNCWTPINQFDGYPQRWGGIQSAYIYSKLRGSTKKTTTEDGRLIEKLSQMRAQYPEVDKKFGMSVQTALGIRIEQMNAQFSRCQAEGKLKIIEEARSFRGSSQLDCAIYDKTNLEELEKERFKTYKLPGILSNFIFEWCEKEYFLERAKKAGIVTNRFEDALCYFKLLGYREVRENWHFYYPKDVKELASSGKVQELKNLEICQPHGSGINRISDSLGRRKLVCFISGCDRNYLRATGRLPLHFQIYPLTNQPEDKAPPYTIAFGQDALLLETLLWHRKPKNDEGWIC